MKRTEMNVTGGCQCGAVRYRSTAMFDNSHICHCRMCQKAVGNVFAALVSAPRDAFSWTRGQPATFYSSGEVERGFCADCGTPLFYNNVTGDSIALTIGTLDHPEQFPPVSHDSIESRVPFVTTLHEIAKVGVTDDNPADWVAAIKASNHQHPDHDTDAWPPQGAD